MRLILTFDEFTLPIDLDARRAPLTAAGLLATLPQRIDLHSSESGGSFIFWQGAFLELPESTVDAETAAPGAFLFWPERQILELIFGPMLGERAQVIYLGAADASVGLLETVGQNVRAEKGRRILWADLSIEGDDGFAPEELPPPELDALVAMRHTLWTDLPEDIAALVAKDENSAGCKQVAEAAHEVRKAQESTLPLWYAAQDGDAANAAREAQLLIQSAKAHLVDLCGLSETGAILDEANRLLQAHPKRAPNILRELILSLGRIASWLEGQLP